MLEEPLAKTHETSDVNVRTTAWLALALVVSVVVIAFLVWKMEASLDPAGVPWPHQPASAEPQVQAALPALQTAPAEDLRVLHAAEDKVLQNYGWVDRKAEVIRIPLGRAKALILERGLPKTGTTMPLPGPQASPPQPALPQGGPP